ASTGLEVKVEAGSVRVFGTDAEADADVSLVRALVVREAHIAIDAEQRRLRVATQMRADPMKRFGGVEHETDARFFDDRLVLCLVLLEPLATIVALQAGQKIE